MTSLTKGVKYPYCAFVMKRKQRDTSAPHPHPRAPPQTPSSTARAVELSGGSMAPWVEGAGSRLGPFFEPSLQLAFQALSLHPQPSQEPRPSHLPFPLSPQSSPWGPLSGAPSPTPSRSSPWRGVVSTQSPSPLRFLSPLFLHLSHLLRCSPFQPGPLLHGGDPSLSRSLST